MADYSLFLLQPTSSSSVNVQETETDGCVSVEEYDDWFVRPHEPMEIFVWWGDKYLPLTYREDVGGYVWPTPAGKRWENLRRGRRTSGYLELYKQVGGLYRALQPRLYIAAASLHEEQYDALLDRIGQLAATDNGAVSSPIAGFLPSHLSDSGQWLHTPSVRNALALLDFYRVCYSAWHHIEAVPARAMRSDTRRAAVDGPLASRSPLLTQRVSERPGHTSVNLPVKVESFDCPENQFLSYVLTHFLFRIDEAEHELKEFADRLGVKRQKPPKDERDAIKVWERGVNSAKAAVQKIKELCQELSAAKTWATQRKKSHPLHHIKPRTVHQPSLWLLRSPGYSTVYRAFRDLVGDVARQVQLDKTRRGLEERAVRPSAELYQIWLFVEIYAMLQERFGFRRTSPSPFYWLHLNGDLLAIREGAPVTLELAVQGRESTYQIRLSYEQTLPYPACEPGKRCYLPQVCASLPCYVSGDDKNLRPDIVLETTHAGVTKRFIIDAKYRRYAHQRGFSNDLRQFGVDTQFDADVLGTAKQKYLDGLDTDAAFIVHSDPDKSYTYFGERVFEPHPHREASAKQSLFPAHRYGAVYATPTQLTNLEILLRCFLMYHAGWYDICWTCGSPLQPQSKEGKLGVNFQCENGHVFWVKSNCGPKEHLLIKLGKQSFHKVAPDNIWNCSCPECGVAYVPPDQRVVNIPEPPSHYGRNANVWG
ncbi:MAG: hypothetical protein KJZ86_23260 [Caldilineaceae bacterium]|nr:hypothetical protein [Caldilineaceae bacterium]